MAEEEGPVGVGESLRGVKRTCNLCGATKCLSWMISCPCCNGTFCYDICTSYDGCVCKECDEHHDGEDGFYFCSRYRLAPGPAPTSVDGTKPHPYAKCPNSKITYEHPRIAYCEQCIKPMDILLLLWTLRDVAEMKYKNGLELDLMIEKRNHARLAAGYQSMIEDVSELGDVAHELGFLKDGAYIVRTVTEYLKKQFEEKRK